MTTISVSTTQSLAAIGTTVMNPYTANPIGTAPDCSVDAVDDIVASARAAAKHWAHTRLTDRQLIFRTFIAKLRSQRDDIARSLTAEIGQPIADSRREVEDALAYFFDAIGESNAFYGHVYPHGAEAITASFLQYTVHEPLGVVAVIMDGEAPVRSFAYQAASTLLVGNVVIVRPSVDAPLTVLKMAELLYESDLPRDALQIVVAGGEATDRLIASPLINGLNFHGTSDEAISATEAARANLTRVVALGGSNDATIIFDDADVEAAVSETVRAAFANAGQNRAGPKRVLVQESIRDTVTDMLVAEARKLTVSDPLDERTQLGTMISEEAARLVGTQLSSAIAAGARMLVGGTVTGAKVSPTILDLPDDAAPLARDEIIRGPVLSIVGFDADSDAYAIANASPYGFGVGVFTSDLQRAGAAFAHLETAVVVINGAGDYRGQRIPFGGVKKSGIGVESLLSTPSATTEIKTILAADIYDFAAVNEKNMAGRHT